MGFGADSIPGKAGAEELGGRKVKAGVVARGEDEKRKGWGGSSSSSSSMNIGL